MLIPTLPSGRKVLLLDLALFFYALLWVLLGVAVANAVSGLTALTDGFEAVGGSIEGAGRALGGISIPLIDADPFAGPAREVVGAGQAVTEGGQTGREEINRAGALLGLVVALLPSLPILLFYVPQRLARAGETGALRQALRRGGDDPELERFLAERAAQSVPYRRLARISGEPWRDLAEGRYRSLALEEVRRLGLSPLQLAEPRPYTEAEMYPERDPHPEADPYAEQERYGEPEPYGEQEGYGEREPYGEGEPFAEQDTYVERETYGESERDLEQDPYGEREPHPEPDPHRHPDA